MSCTSETWRMSQHTLYFPDGESFATTYVECDYRNKIETILIDKAAITHNTYGQNWHENSLEGQAFLVWLKRKKLLPSVAIYLSKRRPSATSGNYAKLKLKLTDEFQNGRNNVDKITVSTFEDCNTCGELIMVDSFVFVDNEGSNIVQVFSNDFTVTCNSEECK